MKLHDTLSDSECAVDSDPVRIYLCGVTVYDESHVGHARTIIIFDVLRRYLEDSGVGVRLIQNFTDVDDKIIQRAKEEDTTVEQISARYIGRYHAEFSKLGVKNATLYPRATDHISEILELINGLVKKRSAYVTENGIYFAVDSFSRYGRLSKKKTDELQVGFRIEVDHSKRNPLDFALWKFASDDPNWDSPWGRGRPGWHIECSAMSLKYLGETFDIHGGGRDLIFPHHENEIAQSVAYTGRQFAKIWVHVGMVTINGQKMSKSLHNIKTVRQALKDWGPNVIRLFCISSHYSKPINYSEDFLIECVQKWRHIEECHYEMLHAQDGKCDVDVTDIVRSTRELFDNAIKSDLNTHLALSTLLKFTREVAYMATKEKLVEKIVQAIRPEFERMLRVLGLTIPEINAKQQEEIKNLTEARDKYRRSKRYQDADRIRHELEQKGIELVDHDNRTVWIKRENIRTDSKD